MIIGTILITLLLVATVTVSAVILASVAIAALKILPRQPANNVCRTKSAA